MQHPKFVQVVHSNGTAYYFFRRGTIRRSLPNIDSPGFAAEYERLLDLSSKTMAAGKKEHEKFKSGRQKLSRRMATNSLIRARAKSVRHEISSDDIDVMIESQMGKCAVTGIPFSDKEFGVDGSRPFLPSIDRIDPAKGYALGNIRIVCQIVNLARNTFSDDAFYLMCEAATRTRRKQERCKKIHMPPIKRVKS